MSPIPSALATAGASRASRAALLLWRAGGGVVRSLAATAASKQPREQGQGQGQGWGREGGRGRGQEAGAGAGAVQKPSRGTRRRGRDDDKTAPAKASASASASNTPAANDAPSPPPGWWGRRGEERVLRVTRREEVTRTAEGEVVRWPRDDRKLLRRTKGRKALLARVAKQDAETARLLDLPASTIKLPANVPRVKGIDRPLLPRGVTEAGLLPSRYWKKETGPGAVPALRPENQALADARPQKVNDLLALVKGARNPETRLLAVQQLQFIRTKLTVGEASSVLDEAMKHFGWRAGLRYVERMGARPEHRLSIRHFNKVVRACCRDQGLRSLRSVLRVVEEMEGQGIPPNHQTIFLGLTAAAERGDAFVAERLLAYARARGIELDKRAQAKAAEALAGGGEAVQEAEADDGFDENERGRRTGKGKKSEKEAAAAAGEGREEEDKEASK